MSNDLEHMLRETIFGSILHDMLKEMDGPDRMQLALTIILSDQHTQDVLKTLIGVLTFGSALIARSRKDASQNSFERGVSLTIQDIVDDVHASLAAKGAKEALLDFLEQIEMREITPANEVVH